ncbi:hypothetical protein [Marinobacter sp. GH_1]|uniref:hypothetical protein n=1 Tax=Marinobacter sp. GH_1 TaxID=3402164 RepID=UPI003B434906
MRPSNIFTKSCTLVLVIFFAACSNADEFASREVIEYARTCDRNLQANIQAVGNGDLELAAYTKVFEFRDQPDKKGIDVWYISSEFSSFGLFVKYVCIFDSQGGFVRSMSQDFEKLDRSQWQSLRKKYQVGQ